MSLLIAIVLGASFAWFVLRPFFRDAREAPSLRKRLEWAERQLQALNARLVSYEGHEGRVRKALGDGDIAKARAEAHHVDTTGVPPEDIERAARYVREQGWVDSDARRVQ